MGVQFSADYMDVEKPFPQELIFYFFTFLLFSPFYMYVRGLMSLEKHIHTITKLCQNASGQQVMLVQYHYIH